MKKAQYPAANFRKAHKNACKARVTPQSYRGEMAFFLTVSAMSGTDKEKRKRILNLMKEWKRFDDKPQAPAWG